MAGRFLKKVLCGFSSEREKIFVSACLIGVESRYNKKSVYNQKVVEFLKDKIVLLCCPEVLAGLSIPRAPLEIKGKVEDLLKGKACVVNGKGKDFTSKIFTACLEIALILKKLKVKKAILKSLSPVCGVGKIYDGSFKGKVIKGDGVLSYLLKKNQIEVFTDAEFR